MSETSETKKGIRKCKDCPNWYKSVKYARCNNCRKKAKQDPTKLYCSGCGKEHPEKSSKNKTCKKCKERSSKNKSVKICGYVQEGKRCKNKPLNSSNMCFEHHDNNTITMKIIKDISSKDIEMKSEEVKELIMVKQYETISEIDLLKSELTQMVELYMKKYKNGSLYYHSLKENKLFEQENYLPLYNKTYYKSLIFDNFKEDAVEKLEPEIIFIKRRKDIKNIKDEDDYVEYLDLYNYFLIYTSSIYGRDEKGRQIKMLIRDKITGKYLGVLKIGSDVGYCSKIDEAIGWDGDLKFGEKKLNYVVNILACVGMQPVAYNMNIGKLLVSLCFTDQVQKEFKRRYGHYFAGVTTFSLYGKSIQYDRLPWIKYKGLTKGYGFHLPIIFYKKGLEYLKLLNIDVTRLNKGFSSKIRKLRKILLSLGYNDELINHGMCRGVYVGYTCKEGQQFLCGEVDKFIPMVTSIKKIVEWWKKRWALNRYKRLYGSKQIKMYVSFNDLIEKKRNCNYVKKYNEKCKEIMGEDMLKKLKRKYMKEYRSKDNLNDFEELSSVKTNIKFDCKYLGGLIDGDGTVCISKMKDGYCLYVLFTQTNIDVLYVLQNMYGGKIYKRMKKKKETNKREYKFRVCGLEAKKILLDLEKGCILKLKQVKLAIEYLELINKEDNMIIKNEYYKKIQNLNLSKNKMNPHLPYNLTSDKYMSGLFDSEGCICVIGNNYGSISIGIAQKSNPLILEKFKEIYKCGIIHKNEDKDILPTSWIVSKRNDVNKILKILVKYSFIKLVQVKSALMISENVMKYKLRGKVTDVDILYRKNLKHKIQSDKHTSIEEDVSVLTEKNRKISIKVKKSKIIHKKVDQTFTYMMKKDTHGGYNKGCKLSIEHKLSISNSKKGSSKLCDDDIAYIIENKGKINQNVLASKFNVCRQYISCIQKESNMNDEERLSNKESKLEKNKRMKKKLSEKDYKKYINSLNSISKRSVDFETVIAILKLKKSGLARKVVAKKFINKKGEPVTIYVVGNIWGGKTTLFEHEFEDKDITYEDYIKML